MLLPDNMLVDFIRAEPHHPDIQVQSEYLTFDTQDSWYKKGRIDCAGN